MAFGEGQGTYRQVEGNKVDTYNHQKLHQRKLSYERKLKKYGEYGTFLTTMGIFPSKFKIDGYYEEWEIKFFQDRYMAVGGTEKEMNSYYKEFGIDRSI